MKTAPQVGTDRIKYCILVFTICIILMNAEMTQEQKAVSNLKELTVESQSFKVKP